MLRPPSIHDLKGIPQIKLLGIHFEWDCSDAADSGIPLLPSQTGWMPDYRSYVAYSIASTATAVSKGKLKLHARFYKNSPNGRVQIRARNVVLDPKAVLLFELNEKYPGQNALGDVAPTTVFFDDQGYSIFRGKNTFLPMYIENPQYPQLGVGIYDINWRWEFRSLDEEATKEQGKTVWEEEWRTIRTSDVKLPIEMLQHLEMTRHRVFITLDLPHSPWTSDQIPDFQGDLPMDLPIKSNVLEIACNWANGATTQEQAAKMIAERLFTDGKLIYDTDSHYSRAGNKPPSTFYLGEKQAKKKASSADSQTMVYFSMSKLLERLEGGVGNGNRVNCLDCALMVVTLANVLGCKLQIGKFQNEADVDASDSDHFLDNRFEINPLKAIGLPDVESSMQCLEVEGKPYFAYHTVAWSSPDPNPIAADFENPAVRVYDACVQFMVGDELVSAADLPLGPGEDPSSYIHHLAKDSKEGIPRCNPQVITVQEIQLI